MSNATHVEIDIDEDGVKSLKGTSDPNGGGQLRLKPKKPQKRDGADESQLGSTQEEIKDLANDAEGG